MKTKIQTAKEILDFEVSFIKDILKRTEQVSPQFNLWTKNGVACIAMLIDKDNYLDALAKPIAQFKPFAISMIAEGWVRNPKTMERTGESVVMATVWTGKEKKSWEAVLTDKRKIREEDFAMEFKSRWDIIGDVLAEIQEN